MGGSARVPCYPVMYGNRHDARLRGAAALRGRHHLRDFFIGDLAVCVQIQFGLGRGVRRGGNPGALCGLGMRAGRKPGRCAAEGNTVDAGLTQGRVRSQAPRWQPTWPQYSAPQKSIYSVHVCAQLMGRDWRIAEEAALDQYGMGISVGTFVLAIAAIAVAVHYRRERRRASLLRNLDHHEWYR